MRFIVGLSAMLAVLLLCACERQDAAPLDQQLYVWQRHWTPAHELALKDSRGDFSTLRVLALQAPAVPVPRRVLPTGRPGRISLHPQVLDCAHPSHT